MTLDGRKTQVKNITPAHLDVKTERGDIRPQMWLRAKSSGLIQEEDSQDKP